MSDAQHQWCQDNLGVDPRQYASNGTSYSDQCQGSPNGQDPPDAGSPAPPAAAPTTDTPPAYSTAAPSTPGATDSPSVSDHQPPVLAAGMIAPMTPGISPQLPPSMMDPSIVDATPWTPIQGGSAAATDAAATTAATDAAATTAATDVPATTAATDVAATTVATDVAATTAVAEVSTADAIIAGAIGVEEGAAVVGLAAAPVPGVDVVVDTGAIVVAAGAAVVLGGALLYKALSDDTPPAQAPGHTPSPAPVQDPTPYQPVTAPSTPVSGPASDPGTPDPAAAPGADQPGPMQASDTQPRSPRYPVPTCDRITIHGTEQIVVYIYHALEIPRGDWADAIDDWQRSGELDHGITELETSIANREEAQQRLGEDSLSELGTPTGATHRQRIEYERALLRAMKKGLGGF